LANTCTAKTIPTNNTVRQFRSDSYFSLADHFNVVKLWLPRTSRQKSEESIRPSRKPSNANSIAKNNRIRSEQRRFKCMIDAKCKWNHNTVWSIPFGTVQTSPFFCCVESHWTIDLSTDKLTLQLNEYPRALFGIHLIELCCASYSNMLLYASSFDLSFLLTPWNIHKTVLLSNWMLHNSVTPHFCTKPMLIQVSQLHWESQAVIKVKTTCCFLRPETSTFHLLLKQANQCIIKHLNTILHSKSNCLPWTNQQYQAAEAKIKAHLAPKAFSEP
jgi:hypothetical protein